jgi:hypothetical protein
MLWMRRKDPACITEEVPETVSELAADVSVLDMVRDLAVLVGSLGFAQLLW